MDDILRAFLETQFAEGEQLAAESDLLDVIPVDEQRLLASFSCRGLIRDAAGTVREHDHFEVGIRFSDEYLRRVDPALVATWISPAEIWHPNIRMPFLCLGPIAPGTPLTELLHRIYEVITGQNVQMDEHDALNHDACAWAREHRARFPLDTRPIKRPTSTSQPAETGAAC